MLKKGYCFWGFHVDRFKDENIKSAEINGTTDAYGTLRKVKSDSLWAGAQVEKWVRPGPGKVPDTLFL